MTITDSQLVDHVAGDNPTPTSRDGPVANDYLRRLRVARKLRCDCIHNVGLVTMRDIKSKKYLVSVRNIGVEPSGEGIVLAMDGSVEPKTAGVDRVPDIEIIRHRVSTVYKR